MSTVDHASWRERSSARWMAWVGAACALLLATVAGVCAMSARGADARWVPTVPEPQRPSALFANPPGRQQRLAGVHASPAPGHLELPRPTSKQPPLHPRADARPGPALRPEALLAERTRRLLSCVLPTTSHGRVADRPIVANCPAQGPPRTA